MAAYSSTSDESTQSQSSTSDSSLSQPKRRKYNHSWENSFPWLECSNEPGQIMMFCRPCKKAKASTVWATSGCETLKKNALVRHAHSAVHQQSLETTQLQKRASSMFEKGNSKTNEDLLVLSRNVYWLAKENIAMLKASSLHDLAKLNGINIEIANYQGKMQFVESLNIVLEGQITEDLKASPYSSLMADESTDISVTKNLILYIRYLKPDQRSVTRYFKLLSLAQSDAATIYSVISDFLTSKNIPKAKLVGWASDGCEVMLGIHTGVQARLKADVPYLTSIHCVAHREALAARQAAEKVPYLQKVEGVLKATYSYFSRSTLRQGRLSEVQKLLDTSKSRLKRPHEIRWLSLIEAVEALCKTYDAVLTCLFADSDDPTASGLVILFLHTVLYSPYIFSGMF